MKLIQSYKHFIAVIFLAAFIFILPNPANAFETDAVTSYNEGIDYSKNGNYQDAVAAFRKAIALDPTFLDAYYNLGSIYEYLNDDNNALIAFEELLTRNPGDSETAYKIASIYYKKGYYDKAIEFIRLIPSDSPKYSDSQSLYKKIVLKKNAIKNAQTAKTITKPVAKTAVKPVAKPAMVKTTIQNFQGPTGITKDRNGNLYVASYGGNSIWQIAPDGKKKLYAKGNSISGPIGLAVDSSNNLYVANYLSNEVIKIDPKGTPSVLLRGIKKPYYLYIDNTGILYISEQGTDTVIKLKVTTNK